MSYDEIAAERELLISQGVEMPNMEDQYYNPDDQFDKFSCYTGDYRASIFTDDSSIAIKVESDLDDYSLSSDTETLCDTSEAISQVQYSTASTITTQNQLNGNEAVIIGAVGVNEHEGMNYDLLVDGLEAYDYNENVLQNGNVNFFIIIMNLSSFKAPEWLLHIFPRLEANDYDNSRPQWDDFVHEMNRTRDLINRVPDSDPTRHLEYATNRLTTAEKDEFRRLGNDLLVRYFSDLQI